MRSNRPDVRNPLLQLPEEVVAAFKALRSYVVDKRSEANRMEKRDRPLSEGTSDQDADVGQVVARPHSGAASG